MELFCCHQFIKRPLLCVAPHVYKVIVLLIICVLVSSCQKERTAIGNGYYYSYSENNNIDGLSPVNLEYSETGRTFVTIYHNLYTSSGDVLIHDKLVIFYADPKGRNTFGSAVAFAATPTAKPISIMPLIEKKRGELLFSKPVDWGKDYYLSQMEGSDRGLIIHLGRRQYVGGLPESVTLNILWSDIESLVSGSSGQIRDK